MEFFFGEQPEKRQKLHSKFCTVSYFIFRITPLLLSVKADLKIEFEMS